MIWLSCALAVVIGQDIPAQDDSFRGISLEQTVPRLRTILPNQLTVFVERMPADYVAAQVWMAGTSPRETLATHGYRHLLEHIMARADGGSWDKKIETLGGLLDAETGRDAIGFRVRVPKRDLGLALDCLAAIVRQRDVTKEAIARESRAISNEAATRSSATERIRLAWDKRFGPTGLDPFGNTDLLANAVPKELEAMWARLTDPRQMAVTVAGDVDVDEVTAQVKRRFQSLLAGLPTKETAAAPSTGVGVPNGIWTLTVGSPGEPSTAAGLVAGFAIASQLPDAFFNYSPVNGRSLIVVGTSEDGPSNPDLEPEELYELGKRLARSWIMRQLSDPAQSAMFRGRLLAQSSGFRPEVMLDNIDSVRRDDFRTAFAAFMESRK